jgi:hypothetical protein
LYYFLLVVVLVSLVLVFHLVLLVVSGRLVGLVSVVY